MANQVSVNRNLCMGAGECVWTAPKVFEMDDEGKAVVVNPDGADDAALKMAMNGCPNFAIRYRAGTD
ncbi:ferredoxin [Sphingobium faniae]|nr:ferredoxin [Sphingobium faniae]